MRMVYIVQCECWVTGTHQTLSASQFESQAHVLWAPTRSHFPPISDTNKIIIINYLAQDFRFLSSNPPQSETAPLCSESSCQWDHMPTYTNIFILLSVFIHGTDAERSQDIEGKTHQKLVTEPWRGRRGRVRLYGGHVLLHREIETSWCDVQSECSSCLVSVT